VLNKLRLSTALLLSGLILSGPAAAQQFANDLTDFQVWGNITATGNWGFVNPDNPTLKKWKWWAEGQGRFGDNASHFSQSLIRPGLGYQVNNTTSIWAGYAWAPTTSPFTRIPVDEQRVWQQVLWRDKFSFGTVQSRSRLEERMIPQLGQDVGLRYRQLLKLSVPLSFAPGFSYIIQDEVFVALNTNDWVPRRGLDNNRFFTGIGYAITKEITGEIGYMNHYIVRRGANLMDHILSINLLANF
jgi:hypothetical protein